MALPRLRKQTITASDVNNMTMEELIRYIPNAAKKSNMNLRALEKTGRYRPSKAYRYIKKLAYDDTDTFSGTEDKPIFRTSIRKGETVQDLRHRAAIIANFRNAPSHTPKGVERQYKKSFETYLKHVAEEAAHDRALLTGEPVTKSLINEEYEKAKGSIDFNDFGEQWRDFGDKKKIEAEYASSAVAQLITEGYSGADIRRALDIMKKDLWNIEDDLQRYRDFINQQLGEGSVYDSPEAEELREMGYTDADIYAAAEFIGEPLTPATLDQYITVLDFRKV